mmetsp:Transcript_24034/g.67302  ORF Transcript_24034/g.67302 Transcript_24034/m.67302 type:complete len:589 (+) Transcript_24034:1033-2799(+)
MMGGRGWWVVAIGVLVVVSPVFATCPSNCSFPNGICVEAQSCECERGWAGDDCSVSDLALEVGQAMLSSVGIKQWKFFHFSAYSTKSAVTVEIRQTSQGGDVDAYIRKDAYPNRGEYDQRDISHSRTAVFTVVRPYGTYFVGVYGFIGAEFSVTYLEARSCPNDCSGFGTCLSSGECECVDGFAGSDCSTPVTRMTNGQGLVSKVFEGEWKHFSLEVPPSHNHVEVTLTDMSGGKDPDLYVNLGALASRTAFLIHDNHDNDDDPVSHVLLADARPGVYYIGVYAYGVGTIDFHLKGESFADCPNSCSGRTHGTCVDNAQCQCQPDYAGDSCEEKRSPLSLDGQIETGMVQGDTWNYYPLITSTSSNVVIRVSHLLDPAPILGDCDVYIQRQRKPGITDWTYVDTSLDLEVVLVMESPLADTWYIGIHGYRPCAYALSATVENTCPNECTSPNHGLCDSGHCRCYGGFTGSDCRYALITLFSGKPTSQVTQAGEWVYFIYRAIGSGPSVCIEVQETGSRGSLALYASFSSTPTHTSYDAYAHDVQKRSQRLMITPTFDTEIIIGVYAPRIYIPTTDTYSFDIVAYQASI